MKSQTDATAGNIAFLRQGIALVERLTPEQFTSTSELCPGGSIGAHLRHCVDFYIAFLDGVESGEIDYNDRRRDAELETEPPRALEAFGSIVDRLEAHSARNREAPLRIRGDGSAEGEQAWSQSTVGRELQFLLSHTIHHFALIGFMLRAGGCEVDASFGVAPSTLRHWENTTTRAS